MYDSLRAMETEPVRIYAEDGKWQADYGPGLSQTFATREQALEAAWRVADREHRDVEEVSAEAAHSLMQAWLDRIAAERAAQAEQAVGSPSR
jgi:hypothetical protein